MTGTCACGSRIRVLAGRLWCTGCRRWVEERTAGHEWQEIFRRAIVLAAAGVLVLIAALALA